MSRIKFGTDGWRAVIGDQFTYDNLERVTLATAQWLVRTYPDPCVVLGHDTRFQGRAFAEHAARIFAHAGIPVLFAETFTPTPAVSWAALHYGRSAGIVITASHNPPAYNGFKIKSHHGGPATPDMIAEVEKELDRLEGVGAERPSFAALCDQGLIELRDLSSHYLGMLGEQIDVAAIRAAGLRVAHDAMYGAGQGLIARLLGDENVVAIRSELNPGFHGQAPEPIERNLQPLADAVVRNGCQAGIANDGDADRVGMYDEHGVYVDSHQLLSLLVHYLHRERGLHGGIIKTFSTTHMLDKMADAYGLPLETTKIGFKYIAGKIIEGDVLVGGEESGGMAVKGHIPERDGLYIGLLVLEMMVRRGRSLSALVQELFDAFGPHRTYREDVHTTAEKKAAALDRLQRERGLRRIAGQDVTALQTLDGFKHITTGGWLLVRPSGTEPVLRVYSEAADAETAQALVQDARVQLGVG